MRKTAIIQARMGSTRLKGKVMRKIKNKTILAHCIERVKRATLIDDIVIATTNNKRDDLIVKEAECCGVSVFRGSEDDVLSRYYYAAKDNKTDIIIRITSDCPLIDPSIIDEVLAFYLENSYDVVTNAPNEEKHRTYPRGMDLSIFDFNKLEDAFKNATKFYHREHVTPFFYENYSKKHYYKSQEDNSKIRLTLDTEEDFKLISKIYDELDSDGNIFGIEDILVLLNNKKDLSSINDNVIQKDYKSR